MRVGLLNDFAIHFEHQPEHAVGGGMLGTEVEGEVADLSHWASRP